MSTIKSLIITLAIPLGLLACDQGSKSANTSKTATAAENKTGGQGTRHAPPIKPEKVADNAWYCDMGTVHYSRPDKGDGKCPLCHMDLKQNSKK